MNRLDLKTASFQKVDITWGEAGWMGLGVVGLSFTLASLLPIPRVILGLLGFAMTVGAFFAKRKVQSLRVSRGKTRDRRYPERG